MPLDMMLQIVDVKTFVCFFTEFPLTPRRAMMLLGEEEKTTTSAPL